MRGAWTQEKRVRQLFVVFVPLFPYSRSRRALAKLKWRTQAIGLLRFLVLLTFRIWWSSGIGGFHRIRYDGPVRDYKPSCGSSDAFYRRRGGAFLV